MPSHELWKTMKNHSNPSFFKISSYLSEKLIWWNILIHSWFDEWFGSPLIWYKFDERIGAPFYFYFSKILNLMKDWRCPHTNYGKLIIVSGWGCDKAGTMYLRDFSGHFLVNMICHNLFVRFIYMLVYLCFIGIYLNSCIHYRQIFQKKSLH